MSAVSCQNQKAAGIAHEGGRHSIGRVALGHDPRANGSCSRIAGTRAWASASVALTSPFVGVPRPVTTLGRSGSPGRPRQRVSSSSEIRCRNTHVLQPEPACRLVPHPVSLGSVMSPPDRCRSKAETRSRCTSSAEASVIVCSSVSRTSDVMTVEGILVKVSQAERPVAGLRQHPGLVQGT